MLSPGRRIRVFLFAAVGATLPAWVDSPAFAGWEAGAKGGYESNLSRSIDDGEGSGFLSAYAGYTKLHSGETRLDWTMGFTVEGAFYPSITDVDSLSAMISPGVAYIFSPVWSMAVTPFLQGKAVQDTEQSAVTFGARLDVIQKFDGGLYLGEYYTYTDSRANEDVYSYTEHAVGAYLGMRWKPGLYTELGYEFSRGDSFLSVKVPETSVAGGTPVGVGAPVGGGGRGSGGGGPQYSQAFDSLVFKEQVDSHSVPVTVGIDWTKRWFSSLNYTYRTWAGDSGKATDHSGYAGFGYRF